MKKKEESILNKLCIPKDITEHAFIITMIGNQEIYIENYRGILDYTESYIRIQGKKQSVIIEGMYLRIIYYTDEDMLIRGTFHNISYLS